MEEQELIQVDLRLPASALDGLSRLAEQLRKLTEAVTRLPQTSGVSDEFVESGSFDPEKFQALRHRSEEAAVRSARTELPEAESALTYVPAPLQEPKSVGSAMSGSPDEPKRAGAVAGGKDVLSVQTTQPATEAEDTGDIPAARPAEEGQAPDIPVVRMEPASQIPEAESAWAQTEAGALPLPSAQGEISAGAEMPLGAGIVVTAQPEAPRSRWTGITEELVVPGPAPLTAEAVSLAFQRDGRRYDNGFPLY